MSNWIPTPTPTGFVPVLDRNELAGGPRLGGLFNGPKTDTSALWKGHAPQFMDGIGPLTLSMAARPAPATPGQTVTIEVEVGNAWGGKISRRFNLGGGLSADLRVGNFQHIEVKAVPDGASVAGNIGIPAGMTVFFSWSFELQPRCPLFLFQDYPLAAVGTVIQAPEGCEFIHVESACTLTFALTQFGTTFVKAVAAGDRVPCTWGAFSCNVTNKFIFESRGL